jgi:restriction system protein
MPDYQSGMLPLLRFAGDGQEHTHAHAVATLADEFRLTPDERSALLPSRTQPIFYNRVHWARTYLRHAGLLESTGLGKFRITGAGLDVLKAKPHRIDNRFLTRFPQFNQFHGKAGVAKGTPVPSTGTASTIKAGKEAQTPEELVETTYQSLRAELAQDLLERIGKCSPAFFERLVVELLVAMGYGGSLQDAGKAVGQSGDGGIDGIIKEDRLGLDAVYLQGKRWTSNCGSPVVQQFAGSLMGKKARKGVLISTSEFTKDAKDYASGIDLRIVLIGGQELAQLMIDHGIGVKEVANYRVYRADADYFVEQ